MSEQMSSSLLTFQSVLQENHFQEQKETTQWQWKASSLFVLF